MLIARDQPIAAGRVRVELTAGLHGKVSGLLHRLDRKVPCRVDHDATLTTHPGDDRGPIFVIMPPPGLTLLATTTRAAPQGFLPTLFRLSFVACGMIEVIGFDRAFQSAVHLIGQRGIAQPPAPAIARPYMHLQLAGNAARGTRQAQQKRRKNPVDDGALAAIQERTSEVIEGALAALLFTTV